MKISAFTVEGSWLILNRSNNGFIPERRMWFLGGIKQIKRQAVRNIDAIVTWGANAAAKGQDLWMGY